MKKVFGTLLLAFFVSLMMFTVSCEDDSSKSSSGESFLQEEFVQMGNHDNTPSGVVYYTLDEKFAIVLDGSTLITYQRPSCSGFDVGSTGNITKNCYASIKFTSEQIDWSSKPYYVTPSELVIYRTECITPESVTNCIPCQN